VSIRVLGPKDFTPRSSDSLLTAFKRAGEPGSVARRPSTFATRHVVPGHKLLAVGLNQTRSGADVVVECHALD
jgi:hypothetical protein